MSKPTPRTRLRRRAQRGSHDDSVIHSIIDEALVCHVGLSHEGQPIVIPTLHVRDGDFVYVHGANANRTLTALRDGAPLCLAFTLVDALVLARSAFHHSMNYRSVVVYGTASEVTDAEEKLHASELLVNRVSRGRWDHCRHPNDAELAATLVLKIPLDEASAKIRTGPPVDDEEDYTLPHWAGLVPLRVARGTPEPDPRLSPEADDPPA